jgi:Ser/Thr protein kinase RdoA (MazF antagonist)
LPSERDQNFLITNSAEEKFVLKIANASEEAAFLEAQNAVLKHLADRISFCQRLVLASSGEELVSVQGLDGARHLVRVVHYLDGVPLAQVNAQPPELLRDLGRKLGQLDRALADFDHAAAHRDFHWDLAHGNRILEEYGELVRDLQLRELIGKHRVTFDSELRRSVIHGDANDYNVLVDPERAEVIGLIDFGDMVYSYTVGNLAVALAYVVLDKTDPRAAAKEVVEGYTSEFALTQEELTALWPLVLMRLCMSVCLAAHQQQQRPDNKYLGVSQRAIEAILPQLFKTELRG